MLTTTTVFPHSFCGSRTRNLLSGPLVQGLTGWELSAAGAPGLHEGGSPSRLSHVAVGRSLKSVPSHMGLSIGQLAKWHLADRKERGGRGKREKYE